MAPRAQGSAWGAPVVLPAVWHRPERFAAPMVALVALRIASVAPLLYAYVLGEKHGAGAMTELPWSWRILGYDSTTVTFEGAAPAHLSSNEIVALLQRLAARHLTEGEVIAASLRKNAPGYAGLLEAIIDAKRPGRTTIMVGTNPYYVATIEHRSR